MSLRNNAALRDLLYCAALALAAFALFMLAKGRVVPGIDGPITFDGQYYMSIFERGYAFDGNIEHKQNSAFLPLTGVVIGLASLLGPGPHALLDVAVLGTLVLFGTLLGMVRLATADGGSREAGYLAALLWAGSPMALYNFVGYSEPLFALMAVWAFVAMRGGRWWAAAALAAVALLARPQALVLAAFVGLAIAHRDGWSPRRWLAGSGAWQTVLIALPLMAFATWLALAYGDSAAYVNSLEAWRRGSFLDGSVAAPSAFAYFLGAVSAESPAVSHWTTLLAMLALANVAAGLLLAACLPRREGVFLVALVAFLAVTASFDATNIARHTFFMFPWALLAGIALGRARVATHWKIAGLLPMLVVFGAIGSEAVARYYRGEWVS